MKTATRWIRRLLDMALIVLVVSVLGLVLAVNLAPALGHHLIVIRGGSMEPNVHLGSVIEISNVQPADLRPGDIVTLKEANGVVVSHRITRLVTASDGLYIETKGDANASVDATLTPVSSVIGRADLAIAGSGYILYMLGMPAGLLSIVSLGMTILFAIWILEEWEEDDGEVQPGYESGPASLARGARAWS
jgi:signal peptidase